MDRDRLLADVLDAVAAQRASEVLPTLAGAEDPYVQHLTTFVAFMAGAGTGPIPTGAADPPTAVLEAATRALAATKDPGVDGVDHLAALPALADEAGNGRVAGFARYVAVEAALASARLDLAQELVVGSSAHETWAGHPYAPVMLACNARTEIFSGNIAAALELLEGPAPDSVPGHLVRATKALAAGNAADLDTMRALIAEVEAADVAPTEHLGRGVHLLLAFGVVALGDTLGAVRHLLRAGGGADLERLTIIDRVLGYELLVAASATENDLALAQAWEQRAVAWADHRIAAPTVSRIQARVALLAGDPATAEQHAAEAVEAADRDDRAIEQAEAEVVRARARISSDQVPQATRDLRAAVEAGDQTGHAAVRLAATRALRPTRRRLPPPNGTGWDSLSVRERDVAELILAGVDNAGIAESLSLSPTTVRTHTTRVLTAFDVGTRIGLLAATRQRPHGELRTPGLTSRQAEVADLVAAGRTNAEVAERLGISIKSVERHVTDILSRWEVRSRFDLAHRWWSEQAG